MSFRLGITGAATAMALWGIVSPASAAIIIHNAPGPVQPSENVLLDSGPTGSTIFGTTNKQSTKVSFQSLADGVKLNAASNGQAGVEAVGGPLDTLRFFLTDGQGFGQVEFALHKAEGTTGNVTVTFFGTFAGGQTSQTFRLGNGNSWFSAETTDGDMITAVAFDTDGVGVGDLRQVRLGGIAPAAAPVPEPASWAMMLGGFALLGAATRRKKVAFA